MSVPKSERSESPVEYIHTARALHVATLRMCVRMPKRYTFFIGQRLADMAGEVHECVICANSVYPRTATDARLRREYLTRASSELRALVSQVEVAMELFGFEGDSAKEWMELVWREIGLVKGVMASDAKRYANLPA